MPCTEEFALGVELEDGDMVPLELFLEESSEGDAADQDEAIKLGDGDSFGILMGTLNLQIVAFEVEVGFGLGENKSLFTRMSDGHGIVD